MNKSIEKKLSTSIGKKVLVMTEYYPFFLVGTLQKVENEEIWVKAKFGVSAPLKNKVFQIRIDAISATFAETEQNKIPDTW
jgi:ferredoxin-fold anticodon binding domain-containing protein